MKRVLLVLCLSFLTLHIFAQTHYVIAFDCTKSMNHPNAYEDKNYTDEARDDTKVWWPAKMAVKDILDHAKNDDRFTIILFQDKVLEVIDNKKSELSWSYINSRMEYAVTLGGNTCILSAWNCAERYLANSSDAVFYLITDGVEEHDTHAAKDIVAIEHTDELCQRILDFCNTHVNTQGFYTNLVRSLHDKKNSKINKALEQSCCFKIPVIGRFPDVEIDMSESNRDYEKSIILTLQHTDINPVTIKGIEVSSTDNYFEVISPAGKIDNDKIELIVKYKGNLPQSIKDNNKYTFSVAFKSRHNEKIQLKEHVIRVTVNFKLSCVAYLPSSKLTGESVYQKPFKLLEKVFPSIAAEKKPTAIEFDLKSIIKGDNHSSVFNDEAIKQNAELTLQIIDRKNKSLPPMTISYNGKECGNLITLKSSDKNSIIQILFDKNANPKKYHFQICIVDGSVKNLDRINFASDCSYTNDVEICFTVKSNPWYVTAIWIIVLLAIVLIIRIIIKNLPNKKMHGQLTSGVLENVMLEGKVKCILTNRRRKQSFISSLLNGPVGFSKPDDFWQQELTIKRGRKFNMIEIMPSNDYKIDGEIRTTPYSVFRMADFTIENIKLERTITINYL